MILQKKARIIEFPKIYDSRGNLSFIEGARHVPFTIRRVFYIYDVPGGATRGGHAHKTCAEVVIAIAGSFDVILTNGKEESKITLNRSNIGVLVPPGSWITMPNFTTGSILLALASEEFDEDDYIRNFDEFIQWADSLPEGARPDINF